VAPNKDGSRDSRSDRYVESYLYDLRADPYELTNLIGLDSHNEVASVMTERLKRRMMEAGEKPAKVDRVPRRPGHQRRVTPDEARR
jgi:hypothetical protein